MGLATDAFRNVELQPQGSVGMAIDYRNRDSLAVRSTGGDGIKGGDCTLLNLQVVGDELAVDHVGMKKVGVHLRTWKVVRLTIPLG